MAGEIIYHGECANPPHRVFLDEHLTPVVQEVLRQDSQSLDFVLIRPKTTPRADYVTVERSVAAAIRDLYPDANPICIKRNSFTEPDGYALAVVEPPAGANWIYISTAALAADSRLVEFTVNSIYIYTLLNQVRSIINNLPPETPFVGAV